MGASGLGKGCWLCESAVNLVARVPGRSGPTPQGDGVSTEDSGGKEDKTKTNVVGWFLIDSVDEIFESEIASVKRS